MLNNVFIYLFLEIKTLNKKDIIKNNYFIKLHISCYFKSQKKNFRNNNNNNEQ
jgi:hypothetical protein